MKIRLIDVAEVIRSKNSGPFEVTLDLIFRDEKLYAKVCGQGVITAELVAGLYGIKPADILNVIQFRPARAIKINFQRPVPSGGLGDTDVYGAQQHVPLLKLEFELQ